MRVLYYSNCSCSQPHIGVFLNSILEEVKNGNEIYWLYCNRAISSCIMNPMGSVGYCKFCNYMNKKLVREYGQNINIVDFSPIHNKNRFFEYRNTSELRNITYKGVHIGLSIMSFYIYMTRNMDFDIDPKQKKFFDTILNEECDSIDAIIPFIEKNSPQKICTYNGRHYENRFIYDLAKSYKIDFDSLEVIGGFSEKYYSVHFHGDLPHSISLNTKMINDTWTNSNESDEIKTQRSALFYEKRRRGVAAGDQVYINGQNDGELPDGFDNTNYNIAIFNSSADEIAAVGGEWEESFKLFENQIECIKFILSNGGNYHFYLRIHPNLKGLKYKYHTDLYSLADIYSNVTVIPPESTISSYSLMAACNKIIVFGSTMGVESCYWEKPVLLVGTAFYAGLNVCYKVNTKQELIKYLNSELKPKPKEGALKYAYYLMDRDVRIDHYQNIDYNYHYIALFGCKLPVANYLKILGSSRLFAIINKLFTSVVSRITPRLFSYKEYIH